MLDIIFFSVLYTVLLMFVSTVYYLKGRKEGIGEVVTILSKHEPEFFKQFKLKLERLVDGNEAGS